MKRLLALLLSLLLLLSTAQAEVVQLQVITPPPQTETGGMLPETRYLRVEPVPNARVLGRVPDGVPLLWTVVSETYAQVNYGGQAGYIYIKDALPASVSPEPLAQPYTAYGAKALSATAQPYVNAETVRVLAAETPLTVVSLCGTLAGVEILGQTLFVPLADLAQVPLDTPCTPYAAEVAAAQAVLALPLSGAEAAGVLTEGAAVTVQGTNGRYLRVTAAGLTGYIPADSLQKDGDAVALTGRMKQAAPCFSRPYGSAASGSTVAAGTVLRFDLRQGKYLHVQGAAYFVAESDVTLLRVRSMAKPAEVYWTCAQPIGTGEDGVLTGQLLPAFTLVKVAQTLGQSYLVTYEGTTGFLPMAGALTREDRPLIAAVTGKGASLRQAAVDGAAFTGATVPESEPLWLAETAEGWYQAVWQGHIGYLLAACVSVRGRDATAPRQEVYLEEDTALLDFPDAALGRSAGVLSGNQVLTVKRENGDFWCVTAQDVEGYLLKSAVRRVAASGTGEVRYYLHLDKSGPTLTVYALDAAGARSDTVARTITPAIGKRSTPTPTGTFTLGTRERWHYFGPSFTPFTIEYTPGRYLHGPLCEGRTIEGVKTSHLDEFGRSVTGGCLRMPYEDAMWIYMHCPAGTQLEITNGPLDAAE